MFHSCFVPLLPRPRLDRFGQRVVAGCFVSLLLTCLGATAAHAGSPVSLTVKGDAGNRLTLAPDFVLGTNWHALHVARVAVRTPGGQRRIEIDQSNLLADGPRVAIGPGCSLVIVDLGPQLTTRTPNDWRHVTHATKIIRCTDDIRAQDDPARALAERARAGAVATAKVGSRIEIQPLFSPTTTRVGGDLPVRVFLDGEAQADATVIAEGPNGQQHQARSDQVGAAVFTIDTPGTWSLSFRAQRDGEPERVATLVFDIAPTSLWTRAEAQP